MLKFFKYELKQNQENEIQPEEYSFFLLVFSIGAKDA